MQVSTNQFHYDKDSRTFSACASDLKACGPSLDIQLKSARTGKVVDFHLDRVACDNEGDVTAWEYSTRFGLKMHLVVYND